MAEKIPREKIPWYPTLHQALCTACGKCLDFCPNGVFQRHDRGIEVSHPYACMVGCAECTTICPVGAIEFPDQEEFLKHLKSLRKQARSSGTRRTSNPRCYL